MHDTLQACQQAINQVLLGKQCRGKRCGAQCAVPAAVAVPAL